MQKQTQQSSAEKYLFIDYIQSWKLILSHDFYSKKSSIEKFNC